MSSSLKEIQRALVELYDLPLDASVDDFVCDEEMAREAIGDGVDRREVLLVAEEPDGYAVGLYVDDAALATLREMAGRDAWLEGDGNRFAAACLATEGVSHFVYLMFRARSDTPVTQLELELQAEVDKYATGLLAGNGVGLIASRSRALRQRLFADARYLDEAGAEEGDRYRLATRLAARYAASLESRHIERGDLEAFARELRRFYRLGPREKIEQSGG
jgi:hypothetical protein